jgi:hypothetical protein
MAEMSKYPSKLREEMASNLFQSNIKFYIEAS